MVIRLALFAVLASCVRGDYRCASDTDCDVGTDGRCELDQRCTVADVTCPLGRRYADLAGPAANQCYDNARAPQNACAAGQPPATSTGCFAAVCERLPSCCETGWSDACVQLAQLACDGSCPLSVAVTADRTDGYVATLLHQRGNGWEVEPVEATRFLEWLPPLAGEPRPRLATLATNGLDVVIDGVTITQQAIEGTTPPAAVNYRGATVIDHDRSGRNRVLLARQQASIRTVIELDLDEGGGFLGARNLGIGLDFLSGGDVNRDAYPDLGTWVAGSYRTLVVRPTSPVTIEAEFATDLAMDTQTDFIRQTRPMVWADVDDDRTLDLVLGGTQLRVYRGSPTGLASTPLAPRDCLDLAADHVQSGSDEMPVEPCTTTSFAVAALPRRDGPTELVIGTYTPAANRSSTPTLGRYRVGPDGALEPQQMIDLACDQCTGILGLLTRDLDGDRELDIIAVDSQLRVIVARSTLDYAGALVEPSPIPFVAGVRVRDVRMSATSLTP